MPEIIVGKRKNRSEMQSEGLENRSSTRCRKPVEKLGGIMIDSITKNMQGRTKERKTQEGKKFDV